MLLLVLIVGWLVPGTALVSTLSVFGILLLPAILTGLVELLRRQRDLSLIHHWRLIARRLWRQVLQEMFSLGVLPYDAQVSIDAIVRTAARLLHTNKNLLEWRTARDAQRSAQDSLAAFYATMRILPFAAFVLLAVILMAVHPATLKVAGPVLALWLISPGIAHHDQHAHSA